MSPHPSALFNHPKLKDVLSLSILSSSSTLVSTQPSTTTTSFPTDHGSLNSAHEGAESSGTLMMAIFCGPPRVPCFRAPIILRVPWRAGQRLAALAVRTTTLNQGEGFPPVLHARQEHSSFRGCPKTDNDSLLRAVPSLGESSKRGGERFVHPFLPCAACPQGSSLDHCAFFRALQLSALILSSLIRNNVTP